MADMQIREIGLISPYVKLEDWVKKEEEIKGQRGFM